MLLDDSLSCRLLMWPDASYPAAEPVNKALTLFGEWTYTTFPVARRHCQRDVASGPDQPALAPHLPWEGAGHALREDCDGPRVRRSGHAEPLRPALG